MAKRKPKRASPKKAKPMSKALIVAVAAVIVIVATAIVLQQQPAQSTQQPYVPAGQEKNYQTISTGNGCKTNQQCFLANCKSNPAVVNCINATAQEVYYVNCNGYMDVSVANNPAKCACVQGTCKMVG
jgi:hypothetical protein